MSEDKIAKLTHSDRELRSIWVGHSTSSVSWKQSWHTSGSEGIWRAHLFQFHDGTPLSREWLVTQVCQALLSAGKDHAPYSGHSFRIGATSTAAERGMEDSLIKVLGRWQSSAYQRYVKIPREHLAVVSKILASE